jgi:hypothetical protein
MIRCRNQLVEPLAAPGLSCVVFAAHCNVVQACDSQMRRNGSCMLHFVQRICLYLRLHVPCWQGVFSPGTFAQLDLPGSWYKALEWQYPPHQRLGAYEEEGRAVNFMKAGITTADRVVTVSPGGCAIVSLFSGVLVGDYLRTASVSSSPCQQVGVSPWGRGRGHHYKL